MPDPWLTTMKPTFQTEWLALPPKESRQILEKIALLTQDPTPDAKVKKQLKYMGGKLHRLRSGNYRIFYTFEHPYVSLLALRRRSDDTYDEDLDVEFLGGLDSGDLSQAKASESAQPNWETLFSAAEPPATPLPEPITVELLHNLRIPAICHPRLLQITTREQLFDCPGLTDSVILTLDEYLFERSLAEVLQQPDFLAGDLDDLLKFKEGDLLGFLLKLDPEQEKYISWALNSSGPTLLKGGPGTGKSTIALYRTRELIRTLKASGIQTPKILFTTYTNALKAFSQQLLTSLLGADVRHVEVRTVDAMASVICRAPGQTATALNMAKDADLKKLMKQAVAQTIAALAGNRLQQQAQAAILRRLTVDYLLEEIGAVIEARSLQTLEDYQATPRTGRSVRLNKTQRQAIWQLRQQFYQLLNQHQLETWQQLRSRAVATLDQMPQPPVYDAVLVDEAQDLDPNALRLLVKLCSAPNRLFITADANQSIYGSSFRWSDVHQDLNFVGRRTGILRINHRTTQEINEAAHAYLHSEALETEAIDRQYIHNGPQPAVRAVLNSADEAELLARFCRTATREFRLGMASCAILTPTEKAGKMIAEQLTRLGVPAQFMSSRELDLKQSGVKVLTLKAAKGLEFPIVAIAGFLGSPFPNIPKGTPDSAQPEIFARERRSLFVGMTRAMRALLLLVPAKNPGMLLQDFDPLLWNLGTPDS